MPVYQVRGLTRRRSGVLGRGGRALSRFVGRERELAMLHERLRHATQGQGQVIGIAGEPGMGKSRLLYEFRQSLRERPVTYCEGHCLAYGRATPYLPVRDLLRQLCGITEAEARRRSRRTSTPTWHAVGMAPADEAPYLLSAPGRGGRWTTPWPRSARRRSGRGPLPSCSRSSWPAVGGKPLMLAVENLHWIDPTSEEWLASLVERLAGAAILLLVTYRPGYRPPWLGQSVATQLALPRLTADDSLVLVQSVPQAEQLPDRLQQAIVGTSGGQSVLSGGAGVGGRGARRPARHPAGMPDTIQAVLAARIDRLPPAAKRLLQTAAVIGTEVSVPLLQAITELPEDTLTRQPAAPPGRRVPL